MSTDPARTRGHLRRICAAVVVAVVASLGLVTGAALTTASAVTDPCAGLNAIACENNKPGTSPSEWDIAPGTGAGDPAIQGFATSMSVNPGSTIAFKIKATTAYTVDIYRLGYYQGLGARRQAATFSVGSPVSQPTCISDAATQNLDCGNWAVSTQWAVPATAVSGVYIAHLIQTNGAESQIPFVVRNDAGRSDVIFKTSDATWQAYNVYGGADFYTAPVSVTGSQPRAFKISYNRPFATRGSDAGRDFVFSNEYPTLRFLERNGVDVSYTTDLDVSAGRTVLTNHRVFMSVGHDEYWTLPERTNVTNARDKGVSLMFLSGNEVYWHSRLEPSIDGTSTPDRTLVTYKDSWESAKIDPSPESTGTWRDPRYAAAPNGNNPENSLTGTMYMSNNTDLAITVTAAEGKARIWRGTALATMGAGTTATLAPHSIGYESDEDVDNGARPAGLMRLTATTGPTSQKIQDVAGVRVAPGTTTHSLTLYRAASGALVFGAGTINWGWGLDENHDGTRSPADSRMQQATLNMLADMGVLPTTLMPGLAAPTKSTDVTPPTVTVTSPASGATLSNGSQVTVTGTATANGGIVTTVEVSLDGGVTYRRATGTTSWSYTGVLPGAGPSTVKVRASDDTANLSTPVSVPVTVTCPCSLFGARTPAVPAVSDASPVELGVKFVPGANGFITGVRFYKGTGNTGTHTGTLWSATGAALATGTFVNEAATGWQTLTFPQAVPVTAGTTYVASYFAPAGRYAADGNFFSSWDFRAAPLTAPGRPSGVMNGVYASGTHAFPTSSYDDTNYWVDVVFTQSDTSAPVVTSRSPVDGATSVATTVDPSAAFAGSVDPASVTMTLKDAAGASVTGSTAFDGTSRTARFTPSAPLTNGTKYTATVSAKSGTGVPMAAPDTWSFTVASANPQPGVCPCSIWTDSATPANPNAPDTGNVEVGAKFFAEVDGTITGVRFYKGPENLGVHTGSLWSSAGARLATVTFSGESSSGWQTASFSAPVAVTANTTYIVSYRAPGGRYALDATGLANAVNNPPLHTVAGGGVYTYGTGAPLTASNSNYWVDVVFTKANTAPTVTRTSPTASATNVSTSATVSATFSTDIQSGSAQLGLTGPGGAAVAGTVTYTASTRTIQLAPGSPLAGGTQYQATVSGAKSLSGLQMAPVTWSFTTVGACPCTLFDSGAVPTTVDTGDPGAVELGVSFAPSVNGSITGLRFYKSAANTGAHVGSLWSAAGTRLASGTFSGESASGWQTLTFSSPVSVFAGTTYVVSYFAPNGRYSVTGGFFTSPYTNGPLTAGTGNGLYTYAGSTTFPTSTYQGSNYWVDPIFTTGTAADTTAPVISSVAATGSGTSATVTWTTNEFSTSRVDYGTTTALGSTATGPSGTSHSVTLSGLAASTTYYYRVTSVDAAANSATSPAAPAAPATFTTPAAGACPCTLFDSSAVPTTVDSTDPSAVELGVSFAPSVNGSVTGLRFYKSAANTGAHVGSLWSASGTRLASGTFSGESASGWQTLTFSSPVSVFAGTTYVVSYFAPNGRYSVTGAFFTSPYSNGPLTAGTGNGLYTYAGSTTLPTSTYQGSNYWVDPIFTTP